MAAMIGALMVQFICGLMRGAFLRSGAPGSMLSQPVRRGIPPRTLVIPLRLLVISVTHRVAVLSEIQPDASQPFNNVGFFSSPCEPDPSK
jgi:hypothetical protein